MPEDLARRSLMRWYFICGVLLIILIYLPALFGGFVWDDHLLILHNPRIKSWSGILEAFRMDFFYGITEVPRITYYRPLITVINVLTYGIFGLESFYFHFENLLFHLANALLVYFLLRLALELSPMASFLGTLIFSIHPVNTEAVAFISGRTDLLATFFYLLAILTINLHSYHRLTSLRIFLLMALVFYILGLLTKENVITLGVMLILISYFRSKSPNPRAYWRSHRSFILNIFLSWFFLTLIYLIIRFFLIKGIGISSYPGGTFLATLLTMSKVFFHYIYLALLPVWQLASYQNFFVVVGAPESFTLAQIFRLILAILGLSVFLLSSLFLFLKGNKFFLPLLWFLFTLLPVLNIFPFGIWLAERFLYLPSIAVAILCSLIYDRIFLNSNKVQHSAFNLQLSAIVFLIASYSMLTFQRNFIWRSNEALWQDCLRKNQRNDVALANMADLMLAQKKYPQAYDYVEKALGLNNPVLRPVMLRIKVQATLGLKNYTEAKSTLKELEETGFNPAWVSFLWGEIFFGLGDSNMAQQYLSQSISLDTKFLSPKVTLIRHYLQTNQQLEKARQLATEALKINPDFADGYLYLASLEERLGNPDEAIKNYQQAIKRAPKNPEPYFFLANLYDELGNKDPRYYSLALRVFGKVLFLEQNHLDAMLNMGLTYVKIGKYAEAKELWTRVLLLDPDNQTARTNLSRLSADLLKPQP